MMNIFKKMLRVYSLLGDRQVFVEQPSLQALDLLSAYLLHLSSDLAHTVGTIMKVFVCCVRVCLLTGPDETCSDC